MTHEQIRTGIQTINEMSKNDMAFLWRHASPGHPYFDRELPFFEIFERRFKELGGFTAAISKSIDKTGVL